MNDGLLLQKTLYNSANPTRRWLHQSRRDWIIDAIGRVLTGRDRAVEVGPGSGIYLPILAAHFTEVVAVDIEDDFLEHAHELSVRHPNIIPQKIDITKPELPESHFDLVLCSEVIEHIADSKAALSQMRRIIKPDGRLILSTPHRWSTLEIVARIALQPGFIQIVRRIYGEAVHETGHINLMTRRSLERQLTHAGFEVQERAVSGFYLPLIAELTGHAGVALQHKLGDWLRSTRLEQLMWTQCYICRPK